MNEQYRKLLEQATIDAFESRFIPGDNPRHVADVVQEKFAELIVLECANLTLSYKTHDHYMGWLDHGDAIAKHFGVKR